MKSFLESNLKAGEEEKPQGREIFKKKLKDVDLWPACIKVIAECHPFLQRQRPSEATSPLYDLGVRLTCDLLLSISFASWNHIKWRNIGLAKNFFQGFP